MSLFCVQRAKDNIHGVVGPLGDFGAQVDVGPLEEKEGLPDTLAEKANEVYSTNNCSLYALEYKEYI